MKYELVKWKNDLWVSVGSFETEIDAEMYAVALIKSGYTEKFAIIRRC